MSAVLNLPKVAFCFLLGCAGGSLSASHSSLAVGKYAAGASLRCSVIPAPLSHGDHPSNPEWLQWGILKTCDVLTGARLDSFC